MHHPLSLLVLSTLAAASAVQHPLADSSSQAPINGKPLVDSNTLQSFMKSDNLLKRAKHLYQIAELSIEEYGHPTRVIGSEGIARSNESLGTPWLILVSNRAYGNYQLHYKDAYRSR